MHIPTLQQPCQQPIHITPELTPLNSTLRIRNGKKFCLPTFTTLPVKKALSVLSLVNTGIMKEQALIFVRHAEILYSNPIPNSPAPADGPVFLKPSNLTV